MLTDVLEVFASTTSIKSVNQTLAKYLGQLWQEKSLKEHRSRAPGGRDKRENRKKDRQTGRQMDTNTDKQWAKRRRVTNVYPSLHPRPYPVALVGSPGHKLLV